MYQMVIKYTKWPLNVRNNHKLYQYFPLQGPHTFTQIWILGLKIYHLATLFETIFCCFGDGDAFLERFKLIIPKSILNTLTPYNQQLWKRVLYITAIFSGFKGNLEVYGRIAFRKIRIQLYLY
jgi:hypothetical protein